MAMVLAVGATAVHPRLAIELAAELAGTRGAEDAQRERRRRPTCSRRSRPACARRSPGWASAPSRRTSAGRCSTSSSSTRRRRPLLPDGRRVARPDDPRRPRRAPAPAPRGGARDPRAGARSRAAAARPGLRPLPGRRRGAPVLAADRRRDPGARRSAADGAAARPPTRCRPRALPRRPSPDRRPPAPCRATSSRPPRPRRRSRSTRSRPRRVDRPALRRVGDERRGAQSPRPTRR